ncbi:hypothetical protein TNIN_183481 [Trichonephila inaurata madagascariensis]|uniref:Uncharacterized protein n=1 Tax=Trichonephila inaurata madagascariensis TaxID=2747483 RepID=A0A8X7CJU4_9ARAC|nr:hypothetical protein TNIN_183481 [Trichonephila inaurata madagascariensis]
MAPHIVDRALVFGLIADTSTLQKCPHMSRDMRKNQVMPPRGVEMMLKFFPTFAVHVIYRLVTGREKGTDNFVRHCLASTLFVAFFFWVKFGNTKLAWSTLSLLILVLLTRVNSAFIYLEAGMLASI